MSAVRRTRWLIALPLVYLALFYAWPLAGLLFETGHLGAAFKQVLSSPAYLSIVWFTLWLAAVSTVLALVLGLPAAYVFARFDFKGKRLLTTLATVPFVLPTVVVAAGFQALLGTRGLINAGLMLGFGLEYPPFNLDQSVFAILWAHVFYNFAVVLRVVGAYWSRLDPALSETACLLGAGRLRLFTRLTWPLIRPAVASAALLVFIFCFSSFGVVLVLGGPAYATVEVAIYRQALQLLRLDVAAVLALIQIGLILGLSLILTRLPGAQFQASGRRFTRSAARPAERRLIGLAVGLIVVLILSPLAALALKSVLGPEGLTLAFYQALFAGDQSSYFYVAPFNAMLNSLVYAGLTMLLACGLGLLACVHLAGRRSSALEAVLLLPLSTSAVTLGLGFLLVFSAPPLKLMGSYWLVPLAHCLVALPFVVRVLLPALRAVPLNQRAAASLLGASPLRVLLTVDLPTIIRPLSAAAIFAFTISLGEFGASVFVARPENPTLPIAIYRYLAQPGFMNYGQAMAMSTVLMLSCAVAFGLLERCQRD